MRAVTKVLKFRLERWIQRGIFHQLVFVGALVVGVAIAGGIVAWIATDGFGSAFDAIWWAFLRLTDPGYLGDDEGAVLRAISTVVTVLGYVLFMGSLIAIMTQWLASTLRRLESGLTPITMHDHVVVLGWTNRTAEVVLQLIGARGRLRRFLAEHRVRALRIVVLADHVDASRRQELRDHVGAVWKEGQVFLRSGSSLELEDLERLDLRRSAAIVVPGADFELGGAELTDTRAVKTLLTLRKLLVPVPLAARPYVVAEIFDARKVEIAESALPDHLEVIASDAVISRLISQSIRHPRLADVFLELLTSSEGNSLYVRRFPGLAGTHPVAVSGAFTRAKVLGALRPAGRRLVPYLNPPSDFRLEEADLIVFVARRYEDCAPSTDPVPPHALPERPRAAGGGAGARFRVLVLGWSHKVPAMLAELSATSAERIEVTIVSRAATAERERAVANVHLDASRVGIDHVEGDYAAVGLMEGIEPERFDSVVFVASAWMQTSEEADARTVLGYVLLESKLRGHDPRPQVVVELLDPTNGRLFADSDDVMFVSSLILSHLAAHVCLRPELNSVYTALFVAGGAEIALRRAEEYGLTERETSFAEVEHEARERGEIALGLLSASGARADRLQLNPPSTRTSTLRDGDGLVVLAHDGGRGGVAAV